MRVKGLIFDPYNNAYIVVLRDEDNSDMLPIWVGKSEASAIGLALESVTAPRPMTHDLMKSFLDTFDAKIISVVITDLNDNTYFATIHLMYEDSEYTVDSRPSDAIALALRSSAPIFASEKGRERAAQDAGLLSGGQQQMLAISRALMGAPEVILLDEPSLGLSPKLTREIFEIVVRINRERGTTVLLVEQNASMALNVADHGYVLENGRIVMEDRCAVLREKEDVKEFYLGMKAGGVRGERRWKKRKTWR